MPITVFFDVPHVYYLPQYRTVIDALQARGTACTLVCYRATRDVLQAVVAKHGYAVEWVDDDGEALEVYQRLSPDWVVFGNAFDGARQIPSGTRKALVYHASGTGFKKASLHPGMADMDVRFVSGPSRVPVFREHFPNVELVEVGFAKLDPLFGAQNDDATFDLAGAGLDPDKRTLLFAPTFYPSCIERMPESFAHEFAAYNLLIKPHDFTLSKKAYAAQRRRLLHWANSDNVYLAERSEYSLLPFMGAADVMITDRSSAVFEFIALDKPAVICDFLKFRWTYRGPFKFRQRKRLDMSAQNFSDIAMHVAKYEDLRHVTAGVVADRQAQSQARQSYADAIMGVRDGRAGERIAEYLLRNSGQSRDG